MSRRVKDLAGRSCSAATAMTRSRTAKGLVALGVVLLTGAGCAAGNASEGEGETRSTMDSMDGERCYQFERNETARALGLPWGIVQLPEFLDEPGDAARRGAWTLHGPEIRENYPFAYWQPVEGAIEFGPEVNGSLSLRLVEDADGRALRGSARRIGDALPPGGSIDRTPVRGVVAHRVVCGARPGEAVSLR